LRGIASPLEFGPTRAAREAFERKVAGHAVSAYFHQYEIVVIFPGPLQADFMHMKEAV
jgi:hypothetical protein